MSGFWPISTLRHLGTFLERLGSSLYKLEAYMVHHAPTEVMKLTGLASGDNWLARFQEYLFKEGAKMQDLADRKLIAMEPVESILVGRKGQIPIGRITPDDIPEDLWKRQVHESIRNDPDVDKFMLDDIAASIHYWMENEEKFGFISPPVFIQDEAFRKLKGLEPRAEGAAMTWSRRPGEFDGYIMIPEHLTKDWQSHGVMVRQNQRSGWWNPGGMPHPVTTVAHEMGHHWSMSLETPELGDFWEATFRHPTMIGQWEVEPPPVRALVSGDIDEMVRWSRSAHLMDELTNEEMVEIFKSYNWRDLRGMLTLITDWMFLGSTQQQISQMVSGYGATNSMELIAELMSEVFTGYEPGQLGRLAVNHIGLDTD